MIFRTAAAAAAFCLLAMPAHAALMSQWTAADMRAVLTEQGLEITEEGVDDDDGDPYLAAVTESGMKFTVYGAACKGEETARICEGAQLSTSFTLDSMEAVTAKVKSLDYAAVSIFADKDEPDLRVTRYVIFDHGIERDNLKTNLDVFLSISEDIWEGL